jgi:hypothetical protein
LHASGIGIIRVIEEMCANPQERCSLLSWTNFCMLINSFQLLSEKECGAIIAQKHQVHKVLDKSHKKRQMLFFVATWANEVDVEAMNLCGHELGKIRVDSPVCPISQCIRYF